AHLMLLKAYRHLPRRARLLVVHCLAPSFAVGSICVIERGDGALLLVRHSYRQRWGFAGGLLQRGEAADVAARREAAEEVGIDLAVGEPSVVVDPDPRRVDVVFPAWPAPGVDTDALVPRSPEIVELRWFPPDALPDLQHEAAGALMALARARTQGSGEGEPPQHG